ncbi:MAG: preprotein translocase subunit YajC [Clostridiales bacterium]|nr:preprotein translocase subunit YajC [Clostridiales bacterium]
MNETASAASSGGSMISLIIWIVLMIVMFYFLLIRPQKKQEKQQKKMLAALQVGDKVVTVGGICGKISKLKDDYVYIETGFMANPNERTTIKFERAAIKTVLTVHEEQ